MSRNEPEIAQNEMPPQQNKFDLGPRWSSEEIQLFFESKINKLSAM